MKQPLSFFFFFGFFALLFTSAFFHHLNLVFFAPFLIVASNKFSLSASLWLALFSGLCIDFFSSCFFGSSAINYLIALYLFYPMRKRFNEELPSLALSMALFSLFFGFVQLFLFMVLARSSTPFLSSLLTILLLLPVTNALYTLLWFVFPLKIVGYLKKRIFLWRLKRRVADE
jgi:hypothetical protein